MPDATRKGCQPPLGEGTRTMQGPRYRYVRVRCITPSHHFDWAKELMIVLFAWTVSRHIASRLLSSRRNGLHCDSASALQGKQMHFTKPGCWPLSGPLGQRSTVAG